MIVSIIVAVAENRVIGNKNSLLWRLKDDMRHFRRITLNHFVIMGRKTFDSIGSPLKDRTNVVITRNKDYWVPGVVVKNSLDEAIQYAGNENQNEVFIIGGAEIYRQSLEIADRIYYTRVNATPHGDVFFPELNWRNWVSRTIGEFQKNDNNEYPFRILELNRKTDGSLRRR